MVAQVSRQLLLDLRGQLPQIAKPNPLNLSRQGLTAQIELRQPLLAQLGQLGIGPVGCADLLRIRLKLLQLGRALFKQVGVLADRLAQLLQVGDGPLDRLAHLVAQGRGELSKVAHLACPGQRVAYPGRLQPLRALETCIGPLRCRGTDSSLAFSGELLALFLLEVVDLRQSAAQLVDLGLNGRICLFAAQAALAGGQGVELAAETGLQLPAARRIQRPQIASTGQARQSIVSQAEGCFALLENPADGGGFLFLVLGLLLGLLDLGRLCLLFGLGRRTLAQLNLVQFTKHVAQPRQAGVDGSVTVGVGKATAQATQRACFAHQLAPQVITVSAAQARQVASAGGAGQGIFAQPQSLVALAQGALEVGLAAGRSFLLLTLLALVLLACQRAGLLVGVIKCRRPFLAQGLLALDELPGSAEPGELLSLRR